jgi:putative tryptophan/tyrosine transport system substrate-binding protein
VVVRITPVKLVITTILGLFTAPLAAEAQQSKSTARRVMDRRALVSAIALSLLAAPLAAAAQQGKVFLLGYLVNGTVSGPRAPHLPSSTAPADKAFLDGMRQLGYVYGKHFIIETRSAQGTLDRLPGLATELVALKVDAIVVGSTPQALAAKHATSTIPIVMTTPGDPVGTMGW